MDAKWAALYEAMSTKHSLVCDKCGNPDYVSGCDEGEAVDYFFNQGWVVFCGKAYCPICENNRKEGRVKK